MLEFKIRLCTVRSLKKVYQPHHDQEQAREEVGLIWAFLHKAEIHFDIS